MNEVYAVGSDERKFVVDRIYPGRDEAIEYGESRKNQSLRWLVKRVPLGADWLSWETVYVIEKGVRV